ncbi:MAG: threonine ammonia-lyase [Nocardioidaceae bacterium]|nr:threonine ammonia-lyase [Nocardioidaceae bacterium]
MAPMTPEAVPTVTLDDILAAREMLTGIVEVSPIEESRSLAALAGVPVYLKCENLQRTGSFKLRGAYVRIARLNAEEQQRGVVAASAGNHAQGVALAATLLGIRSTVFMPQGVPIPKEKATRQYAADVKLVGSSIDAALAAARDFAESTGAVFIHPYDHRDIVAGQGTIGVELIEQVPDCATVLVAVGGGGLAAGIATAVHALRPDVKVVGVQAENAAAYPPSLAAGRPLKVRLGATMADGIALSQPGDVPFAALQRHLDRLLTVSEESMSQALLMVLERAKMVVEPSGAAAVAALLERPGAFEGPVVVVLSGGNIDPLLLMRVIRHGLAAAGRYLAFRVRIPDRPGELFRLLGQLAELQVNILDVAHERTSAHLHVDEVAVALQVETRGEDDCERVLKRLREVGYPVSVA